MATIKAIESRSVHQIQSGQVIVDLISVVKELVENSLDAGATSIEVRFKNHGLDSIEVQDTGKGIGPEDFETIALKHYTSKLSSYEDLASLDTFGFRGEALSSLCALSSFHIITARAEDGSVGKKLEFESSGKLKGVSVVAAQKGTTVTVENIFANLPVRRKELEKNIKREYTKALGHLYAYACVSVNVKISISNQMPKAKKVHVFSTQANHTTKENILNAFGAKTLLSLVKLDLHLEMEPSKGPLTQSARNWSTQAVDRSMEVHVLGHISKPVFGEGRQAPDRQMFFVNSRPCSLPQVAKAFNEVYKSFNVSQTPFIFANIIMDTNAYDVNVSPDKRSIMLHDQTLLLDSLKKALTELFEQSDYTVPHSTLPNRRLPNYKPLTVPERSVSTDSPLDKSDSGEDSASEEDETTGDSTRKTGLSVGTPPSLIHDWTGRDIEQRKESVAPRKSHAPPEKDRQSTVVAADPREDRHTNDAVAEKPQDGFTRPTVELNRLESVTPPIEPKTQRRARTNPAPAGPAFVDVGPLSTPYDDPFSQKPNNFQRRVDDFKALVNGDTSARNESNAIPEESPEVSMADAEETPEAPIPAIASSSQKSTPGPIQNAFDRMRPRRTPLQTAEITIGNTTTTTTIGSHNPYKKRRVHQPVNSQSIAQFGASPLLARGLRNFAAPGSQLDIDSGDILASEEKSPESDDDDDDADEPALMMIDDDSDSHSDDHEDGLGIDGEAKIDVHPSSNNLLSEPLDALMPAPIDDDDYDEDYVDETEKKIREDEKIARLIQAAELDAAKPTEENLRRASQVLKNTGNRKEATLRLVQYVDTSTDQIKSEILGSKSYSQSQPKASQRDQKDNAIVKDEIADANAAESRLSLTVNKSDFEHMAIIGQFNLGFILAVRTALGKEDEDELFIIDQHAADEKYNYERLQRTVTLQNQRLVRPKPLDLTAVEEEIILNNTPALKANGFEIEISPPSNFTAPDEDQATSLQPQSNLSRTYRLLALPMSKEKTFSPSDLEELLHLLSESPVGSSEIPRPKKVQSMLAMRACRSSIMVGKTLTMKQMGKVVGHMGEMEKPWNCPHGRPTMRHLASLGGWRGWREEDEMGEEQEWEGGEGRGTDWRGWLEGRKG